MRTTVTLDADAEGIIRTLMERRGVSFKQALNDAIRAGATPGPRPDFTTRVRSMGAPTINLDRALALAGALEDDELTRRMESGK
jgi:hypothetical protein